METLTKETYRTNHNFMSYSTFSKYLECEAAAKEHYSEPSSTAMLVGSYVDAHFSNELEDFKAEHPEIMNSRTGELKADFKQADTIIERLESDPLMMQYMSGEKQRIMTGEILGMPFKIKMDSYKEGEFIVDLKVMKDFKRVYSDNFRSYVPFFKAYNYDIELALFQEIVRQNTGKQLPCYLACITKEDPADVSLIQFSQEELDEALEIIKQDIPRIKKILNGEVAPHRCETCAYCRMTKRARLITTEMVGLTGDQLREMGVESDDPIKKEV